MANTNTASTIWQPVLQDLGALWRYSEKNAFHVKTSKHMHTDRYLNTDYVFCNPALLDSMVAEFFDPEIRNRGKIAWVATHAPYGLPFAQAIARGAGAKFCYMRKVSEGRIFFPTSEGEVALVVSDDIYSGGSVLKTIGALQRRELCIQDYVLCLGNFSGRSEIAGKQIVALLHEDAQFWEEDDCPMCKEGSRAVFARPDWELLTR